MEYAVTLTPDDNDTFLVTFPDVEGAVTYGDTIEEALAHAPEALATILEAYIKDRRPIPRPTTRRSKYRVTVPALVDAKIRLYEAMQAANVGKAELGRRLNWHPPQVDRLLAMHHGSKLDQLEAAFGALGKRLVVDVQDLDRRIGLMTGQFTQVSNKVAGSTAARPARKRSRTARTRRG